MSDVITLREPRNCSTPYGSQV